MLVTRAYRFALDPTPAQARKLASHAGAARFAYNFGLALVKERLERRHAGEQAEVPWTLPALRREWNQASQRRGRAVVGTEQQGGCVFGAGWARCGAEGVL